MIDRGSRPCSRCPRPAAIGVLCGPCAAALPPADGLLRDHVSSGGARPGAAACLVDSFGGAHPVVPRTRIGRRPGSELVILHGSVSRDHAEVVRTDDGWQLRDLGSRNGTRLDGRAVHGRAALVDGTLVRVGEVALWFVARAPQLAGAEAPRGPATTHAAGAGLFRAFLRGPTLELCLLGGDDAASGGPLLHRAVGASAWQELSLPPLEYQLLRALCGRALDEPDSPLTSRGCVLTRQLVRALPFQAEHAGEENVRQVVRRARATLDGVGAHGVIEAAPGRGYFVAWPVSAG